MVALPQESEVTRILASGERVCHGRVNGSLAVSRAFGDFSFKREDLPQADQAVSVEPDVSGAFTWQQTLL